MWFDLEYFEFSEGQLFAKFLAFKISKTFVMVSFHIRTFKIINLKLFFPFGKYVFFINFLTPSLSGASNYLIKVDPETI